MDIATARAEITHGREDLQLAKRERHQRADAFWQQTIQAGLSAQTSIGQHQKMAQRDNGDQHQAQ